MAEKITKKPSISVKSLSAPKRISGTHKMEATWKIPNDLVNSKKNDRATSLKVTWSLGIPGKDPKDVEWEPNEKATRDTINLNNIKIGKKTYTRDSFYPRHGTRKLKYVTVRVQAKNKKGTESGVKETRKFEQPRKPNISALSFNTENGVVSATITTDAGDDYHERDDTWYTMKVTNPFENGGKEKTVHNTYTRQTSHTITYDASSYMQLDPVTQFIKIVVTAYARGYAGNSDAATPRTMYVSYPAQASIDGVDVVGRDATSKCTVRINPNSTTEHPVDKVRLEYAADVIYDNADDIPGGEWTTTDIVDNGKCTALSIATSELIPSRGNHTFVRVVTYHLHEGVLYRYSKPYKISKLEVEQAPAASIDIDIIDARPGADGKSAVVTLGWNGDGSDDFTGTEISWAETEDTWKSTEDPDSYRFTWSDGIYPKTGTVEYNDSATITIKGLSEGETYYIKARRYLDAEIEQTSEYTESAIVTTNQAPESIVASCLPAVAEGNPLTVYWTFAGNGIQTDWRLPHLVYDSIEDEYVQDGTYLGTGKGSTGAVQISAETLADFANNNVVTFAAEASTGSKFETSNMLTVNIVQQPTLAITAPSIMVEQPYQFTAVSNILCDLILIVTSQGASGQFPQGKLRQTAGDTIYSNVVTPEWVADESNWSAQITLPNGLAFWNLGTYTLSVVAIDRTTNLRSPEVITSFGVEWTNQAVSPTQLAYTATADTEVDVNKAYYELVESEYIEVIPDGTENPASEGWYTQTVTEYVSLIVIDEKDVDGDHIQAVQINLTPPAGSRETDVYDIYRMDIEKPHLIGEGFPLTYTAIDEYAPFSEDDELSYRIAIRTEDGDIEFADISYSAECKNIRFDWADGSLELPYGNSISDSFVKDVDIRQHMNGSSDGYWNPNIERKSSLNSSIIKIAQPRDIERTRALARHAGAVFVRLPNGSAFEADVQVTDLSNKNKAVVAVAFDVTEVRLTDEFKLTTPFQKVEEE